MNKRLATLTMLTIFALTLVAGFIADSQRADAIPAFARKYRMSCTTCHSPIPRLKPYGDEYAANGFVLKDQEAPRYFVDAGDQNLSLIREFPIAVRFDGYLQYASETDRDLDFSSPYIVKLLSGGSLGYNLAYYFYFLMSERGEIVGIEDAYLMYNNLGGVNFDIYVGQFQVSDPIFKRELRLTYEDYQIYKTKPGESQIGLTYDRGVMLSYGIENGPSLLVEILNGNGLPEADELRVYDSDKYKNFMGRISWDLNENLRLGGMSYYGKEGSAVTSEVWMLGPDATITDGKYLELNLQYVERRDSNPLFAHGAIPDNHVKTRGGFAELIVTPHGDRSRWYMVGLVNFVEVDPNGYAWGEPADILRWKYRSVSGHVGYLLRTNVRLVAELMYDLEAEEFRQVVGFVSAF